MSKNPIDSYISIIGDRFKRETASEHSYRGDLAVLIEQLVSDVIATNEPKRIECGAPDYIITKKGTEVPVGYIEAKTIGSNLADKLYKEQFERYKASLDNLIFTDYLDFHFYKNGVFVTSIKIGELTTVINKSGNQLFKAEVTPIQENFEQFKNLITNFTQTVTQTIKSPTKLAEMMASKARLMADVIEKSLDEDDKNEVKSNLKGQMEAFKNLLIHDITNKGFADIYSQTIAYGMFAARYHDPTLPTFTRQEAATLIPKTNPFLRKLFQDIAGFDLDGRLLWMVDELVSIFLASDVATIMHNFGKSTKQEDPVIHFYETFLAAYSPALRKARGVWYTPQPVVNFIVRAVDDVLKSEFKIKDGLADTTKIKIKQKSITKATPDKRSINKEVETEIEVHKVQILDPATGTGTFLAEIVKHIFKKFEGQQGIWNSYVEQHLIPRLNGFELLMASYAMAHLKMDILLDETGYKSTRDQRFRIFLTNSLEEYHPDAGTLFASWLSDEANQANQIKRDTPVMVVMGNPPYSGESSNKGQWIMTLMEDYKKEPGGKEKLKEQNSKFINDDYVKFLRYGQYYIEKNGEGILAFINPHGFLDNPTFRGMRWNLLKTYDKIYTIDLHGNAKKNETALDGGVDQNVFDIMQGVSINIFIKTGKKKENDLGKVYHFDLLGKREAKYNFLNQRSLFDISFNEITNTPPMYFMVQKNLMMQDEYSNGFALNEIFNINSLGLLTKRDKFITDFKKESISKRLNDFLENEISDEALSKKYDLKLKDNDKWDLSKSRTQLKKQGIIENNFKVQNYRCFDTRYIYYDTNFVARLNTKVLRHLDSENLAIISTRQLADNTFHHIFISNRMSDQCFISNKTKEGCQVFPLYLYPENTEQHSIEQDAKRKPNLNLQIIRLIEKGLKLDFTEEKDPNKNTFSPVDLLDYIYSVLHSPNYRLKFKEFLKIDFPKVPFPKDPKGFWALVKLGSELRELHLLESDLVNKYITSYPVTGTNEILKPKYNEGRVIINDTQYFDKVPLVAWDFYIGGYQPAQKWLKDRQGRVLEFDDILHYQKMIVALTETHRIMQEIDKIDL